MNFYHSCHERRRKVYYWIFALSIPLAWGLNALLRRAGLENLWYLDAPSVGGFYLLLDGLFSKVLWKTRLARVLDLVEVPDLSGQWTGELQTSHDGATKKHPIKIQVSQDWRKLGLLLEGPSSSSVSKVAAFSVEKGLPGRLVYTYANKPHGLATPSMEQHDGTCELTLSADGRSFVGAYYSGRGRANVGEFHVVRA